MNAVFKTKAAVQNKVFLFADLYAEHRGVSYGMFDRNNTVVYPVIYLYATDTLKFFSDSIKLRAKVGQFINERLDEGLMIYNIDVQGVQVEAAIKKWKF